MVQRKQLIEKRVRPGWKLPQQLVNLVAVVAAARGKAHDEFVEEILNRELKRQAEALKGV
jgi:hypothetical protein